MSEFMGDTASSAPERPNRRETVMTLTTARNMVPLVRHIVADVLQAKRTLAQMQPEQEALERRRHSLTWPERSRRYQLQDEISRQERSLQDALAEMDGLGVTLVDAHQGRVGFPTMVNGRRAFFSWRPTEESLRHWHYAGENALRIIPATWIDPVENGVSSKG